MPSNCSVARSLVPGQLPSTTLDSPISISESRPNPASATDNAETAAMAGTTILATFSPVHLPSRLGPGWGLEWASQEV